MSSSTSSTAVISRDHLHGRCIVVSLRTPCDHPTLRTRVVEGLFSKGRRRRLALHPLEPLRPLLRRLERLGVVAGLPEDLPVAQLEDEHEVPFSPTIVVEDPLNDPQPLPYQHATQPPGRSRSGVGLLER